MRCIIMLIIHVLWGLVLGDVTSKIEKQNSLKSCAVTKTWMNFFRRTKTYNIIFMNIIDYKVLCDLSDQKHHPC